MVFPGLLDFPQWAISVYKVLSWTVCSGMARLLAGLFSWVWGDSLGSHHFCGALEASTAHLLPSVSGLTICRGTSTAGLSIGLPVRPGCFLFTALAPGLTPKFLDLGTL